MQYYYNKELKNTSFEEVIDRVTVALKDEGFGVLTEIDVRETLKKKLDVDFKPYRILGACNPQFAHRALQTEDKIGTMLPCNVIVQQKDDKTVEVAAINPVASMQAVASEPLTKIAEDVAERLSKVLNSL